MKKWLKTYYPILFLPILYIPYGFINEVLIVGVFGCPCTNPNFNANNITDIFWILVGVITLLLFIVNFIRNFGLKNKRNIVIFIVSLILIALYSAWLTYIFIKSLYWR